MAIQLRRGTIAQWESNKSNIVVGEPAVATDTEELFIGTGEGTYFEVLNADAIADEYNTASSYSVGDVVRYQGKLYKCNTDTSGAWVAANWDETTVNSLIDNSIGDGEITTAKLADSGVNTAKLASNAVTSVKIANGAVTSEKIGEGAVQTANIYGGAVTSAKLANGAVETAKLADSSVTPAKLNGVIDSTLATSGKAADAKATGDAIADVNNALDDYIYNGIEYIFGDFVVGTLLQTNGDIYPDPKRIATQYMVYYEKSVTYTIDNSYVVGAMEMNSDGTKKVNVSEKTGTWTVPANTYWKYYIRKSTEDTNATVNSFRPKVYKDSEVEIVKADVSTLNEKNKELYVTPVLRNGTVGNASSAYSVATGNIISVENASSVQLNINRTPTSGNYYVVQYTTYSISEGVTTASTSYRLLIEMLTGGISQTKFTIHFDPNTKGFAFALFEYAVSDNSMQTIRIADTGTSFIDVYKQFYDSIITFPVLRNGSVSSPTNTYAVATNNIIPTNGAKSATVVVNKNFDTDHICRVQYTTYSISAGATSSSISYRIKKDINIDLTEGKTGCTIDLEGCEGFAVAIWDVYNNNFTAIRTTLDGSQFVEVSLTYGSSNSNNYVIGSDGLKKGVVSVSVDPSKYITCEQAFCIYNNKIYSTDGTQISVQDMSFTEEDSATLSLGHGNSMQLGSSNIAYVSGWDDQKIYAVDLDTLTISDTYTLPTTGYTSAVVDDVNMIAYVLQRDTAPTTLENYNLMAVDLSDLSIISTKKVMSFLALQDMDFVNGKILFCYGLGSDSVNGIVVMDINGTVLAKYHIDELDAVEGEGVCFDRLNGGIYYSTYSKNLFRITY